MMGFLPHGETVQGEVMKYWYAIGTGNLVPWMRRSRDAVKFMSRQEGFVAVHDSRMSGQKGGILWFFDSENAAKIARNNGRAMGIQFGVNITRWIVGADGVPNFDMTQLDGNGRLQ